MNRFVLFFFRLLVMAFGFFIACVVTATLLLLLTYAVTPEEVRAIAENGTVTGLMIGVLAVATITAYAAMVPGMFVAIFAEMRSMRGWLFYGLSGSVIAMGSLGFVALNPQQATGPSFHFFAIATASGFLGGLAYWAVAGHRAGGWLPRQIKRRRLERLARSENGEES